MNIFKHKMEHKLNIMHLETDLHSFAKEEFNNDQRP